MQMIGNVQLIAGDERALPEILALLEREGIETRGNPDIDIRMYAQFKVDDARQLVERAHGKPLGERRVFIIVSPNLLYEAQNTLLKTFEEPPSNALFFFIVPSPEALLSTIRSRAQTLVLRGEATNDAVDVQAFLKAAPHARLDMIKTLIARDEDDVRDIAPIVRFLAALERVLAAHPGAHREGLESVYRARRYLTDKGSLLKTLLEQVALLVPRV